MDLPRIGLDLVEKGNALGALSAIERAERRGVPMIWSTVSRGAPDPVTFFAAGLVKTSTVGLGTAIVPTYPRHPVVLATQVLALDQLSPGRFRLGIGPSHRPTIEGAWGLEMGKPLEHLREYLTVLRSLLETGTVDFSGDYYRVKTDIGGTTRTPIYISALRKNAYRLAGEAADGAISWVSPLAYLRDTAVPALRQGARQAGRPVPRMIAHIPVVMTDDREAMLSTARPRIGHYGRLPFYAGMFADAGYPVGPDGAVSDDLLDHLVVWGTARQVRDRLAAALGGGIDELLLMLIPTAQGVAGDQEAALSAIAVELAR